MEVAKSDRVGQINRTVVLENYGLADILSGHWGGGGGTRYLYCRYCYIDYSLIYVYWKKMYGQPIMHFHNKINYFFI